MIRKILILVVLYISCVSGFFKRERGYVRHSYLERLGNNLINQILELQKELPHETEDCLTEEHLKLLMIEELEEKHATLELEHSKLKDSSKKPTKCCPRLCIW